MKVTLMRHLPTKNNLTCVFIGREDLDCDSNYISQHRAAILKIKNELDDFDVFYSSPLKRAIQSANVVIDHHLINIDNRLIERDLGNWSNVPKNLLKESYPEAFYSNGRLKFTFTPEGGEDFCHLIDRVSAFFIDVFEHHSNESVGIMTHNGVITTVKCLMAKNLLDSSIHGFQPYLEPYIINIDNGIISYLQETRMKCKEILEEYLTKRGL